MPAPDPVPAEDLVTAEDVAALAPVLHQGLATLVDEHLSLDDLVQEALTRTLGVRHRLAPDTVAAYALVVGRNEAISGQRRRALEQRHLPRLLDLDPGPEGPELAEQAAEYAALRQALGRLPVPDQDLLLLRYAVGVQERLDGAATARLARARARLRVEYVLALRRVELPSPRCRQVLLALSSGQRRRQQEVGAANHLLACVVCAGLAPALMKRSRGLAAVAWVGVLLAVVRGLLSRHPVSSAAGTATLLTLAGAAVVLSPGTHHAAGAAAEARPARAPVAVAAPPLRLDVGHSVTVTGGHVRAVPADEGFWLDLRSGQRVWVQLASYGESRQQVLPGETMTFAAVVRAVPAGFADRIGLTAAEGAARLRAAGVYLSVRPQDLRSR